MRYKAYASPRCREIKCLRNGMRLVKAVRIEFERPQILDDVVVETRMEAGGYPKDGFIP